MKKKVFTSHSYEDREDQLKMDSKCNKFLATNQSSQMEDIVVNKMKGNINMTNEVNVLHYLFQRAESDLLHWNGQNFILVVDY